MTIDTAQFLATFYDEAFEGVEVMESGLLNLDPEAPDVEQVNEIFRAAHSIKGGAGMFDLDEVAGFTHLMETLLDRIRGGEQQPEQSVVDLLLRAVDTLRDLLAANRRGLAVDEDRVDEVRDQLTQALDGDVVAEAATVGEASAQGGGWHIGFRPHSGLFLTGNEPLRIFRELAELGRLSARVDAQALPELDALDPEVSYLAWELTLHGEVERAALDEAFAWVEDDCELSFGRLTERRTGGDRRQGGDRRRAGGRRQEGGHGVAESDSIRVNIEKIDAIINLVGELVITQSMLSTLGENFEMDRVQRLNDGLVQLERNTRELQEEVMRMRMLPISHVFNRFPRMVHDQAQKLGKQVELALEGGATELDKTLVERITDPLVHLVRNAMDHGIEPPDERIAAGKPAFGTVSLNAYHKGGNIVIEVGDDGRGLDAERIRVKAVERGLIGEDVELEPEQAYDLLFQPGFSTAAQVSDLSGRGVGMDVVRRNIQELNGSVDIDTALGQGTTFTVRLPLTLAILEGQSVRVGDEVYIVPLVSISESIQIEPERVSRIAGKGETFEWRGEYLRVIRLASLFDIPGSHKALHEGLLVVVEGDGRHVGLFVDELLGQQQVVIKSMEENYQRIDGVSGATILGDGSVAMILDITGLIRLSSEDGYGLRAAGQQPSA